MDTKKESRSKVAFCPCGCGGWQVLATMPFAETDKDAVKDFREAAKDGCRIEYLEKSEIPLEKAGCQKRAKQMALDFTPKKEN